MDEISKKQAEKILEVISKQSFADFYMNDGIFEQYITGYGPVTKEDVIEEIIKLFKLEGE
jgi:hypothetical protein